MIRAPKGCPLSGAAFRLANGQRCIALTGRHRSDDHLWFTFFHEAAHLVLHDAEALYLDEIELGSSGGQSGDERQADEFAGELLVPPIYSDWVVRAKDSPFELRTIAGEIGVSTGILVGHLQHRGELGYRTGLNRLKRRFVWNGPNLEKA